MRIISADALAALRSGRFAVRCLVKLIPAAPDDPLCVWDDVGSIISGGDTYIGAAGRFTVESATSAKDLSIRNLNITFSGLDPQVVALVEGANWHQRPVLVQRAVIATENPQILHLIPEFAGFMDKLIWTESVGNASRLVVQCESASREYSRSGSRTASDADQRTRDPLDGFFSRANDAVAQTVDWGRVSQPGKQKQSKSFIQKIFGL